MQSRSRLMNTVWPEYLGISSHRSCQLSMVAFADEVGAVGDAHLAVVGRQPPRIRRAELLARCS